MISWDDAQTISQKLAQDSSASAITFLNMMMNVGYKDILVKLARQVTEQQATASTVVAQRNYQVPPDCNIIKTIVLIDGSTRTNVMEEPSDRYWEARRYSDIQGKPTRFHFRPRFGVGGGIIQLDPIPSSADYQLEITYEATERDLSNAKVTTGTVALNNNSATVTGTGTNFTADMVGRYLRLSSAGAQRLPYRVKQVASVTSLALENVYHGSNGTGLSYEIFEMFALPEDCQMLPIYYALWQWWDSKGNVLRAAKAQKQYENGLMMAKKTHSTMTRDNIINYETPPVILGDDTYPANFPLGVTS